MGSIDTEQVKKIAELSRLSLTDEETDLYTEQLGKILEYASHLPELPESQNYNGPALRLDEDEARSSETQDQLLKNAVATENGFVKVPAILDKSES